MKRWTDNTFFGQDTWRGPRSITDLQFERCEFQSCFVAVPERLSDRTLVRNVTLRKCRQSDCSLKGAILEDVVVEDLGRGGRDPLFLWGCVFKHVVLRGRITALKINHWIDAHFDTAPQRQQMWTDAAREFYRSVDWALDISAAECTSAFELSAVPGHLVKRDPETQVLVTRRKVAAADLTALGFDRTGTGVALRWFLEYGVYDDVVLIAPKKSRELCQGYLRAFAVLRKEGIAKAE